MGHSAGGNWLFYLISIDAILVLSGAVLTSYVGVGGLIERMTLDRILPKFLIIRNKKGSSYLIFITFFILCVTILFITQGNLEALAGVYTIAFLRVMIWFGIGNLLLKINRNKLPRPERVGYVALFIAVAGVITALIGNMMLKPEYLGIFVEYLIPTLLIIGFMLYRIPVLKALLLFVKYLTPKGKPVFENIDRRIIRIIHRINSQEFVFFTKKDDVATLNKVLRYITINENTRRLKIVAVLEPSKHLPVNLKADVEVLDRAYPDIVIEHIEEHGVFGPEKIKELSKKWNIPINFMFIGAPGEKFPFKIQELGDVRLII
ncbi:MAG: amino acid permease, partial [Gelidibacter sp.]|nr:amino acid permease [Gelidibacter sp.]